MDELVIELTDKTFTVAIREGTCLVDFYAPWCQPCKPVAELFKKYAMQYPLVHFYKVDVEKCPSAAATCGISNLPTVYVFHNGEFRSAIFSNFDSNLRKELRY